uniref:Choline transporter-like protein n=1 Tax=Plectus sambesii TaxID=2011161 RepID=A0A914XSY3_9BILA
MKPKQNMPPPRQIHMGPRSLPLKNHHIPLNQYPPALVPQPLSKIPQRQQQLPPNIASSPARFAVKNKKFSNAAVAPTDSPPDSGYRQRMPRKMSINPLVHSSRSCTDVICCFLFLVFIIGWAVVAGMAFYYGNPERLVNPSDSQGRTCGVKRPGAYDLSTKPYLYYFDLTKCVSYATVFEGCLTPQVCVERCPTYYFTYRQLNYVPLEYFDVVMQNSSVCLTNEIKNSIKSPEQMKAAVDADKCAAYVVSTTPVLGRCIPDVIVNAGSAFSLSSNESLDKLALFGDPDGKVPNPMQLGNSSGFVKAMIEAKAVGEKILSDLSVSWWQILAMLLIAAIVSFLWIVLMRIFGGLMVWLSIFAVVILLAAGAGFCGYKYKTLRDAGAVNDYHLTTNINLYFEMPNTFLYSGIVLAVLLLIVLLILLFIRKRVQIAIALITESSKAIGNMLSSLFFPVIPFLLHVLVFVLWASIAIWLQSWGKENCRRMGVPDYELNLNATNGNGSKCDCNLINATKEERYCTFVNYTTNSDYVIYFQAYNLFGFFWLACFVSGLADLALAGAFASHYWAFRKPDDVPSFPVLRALGRAIRYHLGSIAFGALLLATVKFIRALLDYLDKKLSAAQNKVAKFIMLCLKCCFWCLEKFLRFLTRNAYIMIAIYGKNFCTSASDSFMLLARNIVRVVVLDKVTDFLLFLGKFGITIGMGILSFYYFSGKWIIHGFLTISLNYYFVPVAIVIIGTYFICDAFFDVYEMAVDTTFLCFLEDSERNDGSPEKPYFMSKELLRILGKENNFHAEKASYHS